MRTYKIVETKRRITRQLIFMVAAILALLAIGLMGPDEVDLEQRRYCEMVALYNQDPSTGWPDYKGIYNSECNHEER